MADDPVSKFLREHASDYFYCPKLRGTMSKRYCAERASNDVMARWFGGRMVEAAASPMDKFCRACPLGAKRVEKFGLKKKGG